MVPVRERGQAALVMVVGLLVLAVGMYTTYSIGRTVYAKVKLQNAADAVAYSTAVREARAMNFAAFANRMQVASYVQLMEEQGKFSNWLFEMSLNGYWLDLLTSFKTQYKNLVGSSLDLQISYLNARYHEQKAEILLRETALEAFALRTQVLSTATFAMSAALVVSAATEAASGDAFIAKANDADAEGNAVTAVLNTVNAARFALALDPASYAPELLPGPDAQRAERLITEIANASRYGASPADIVSRSVGGAIPADLQNVAGRIPFVGSLLGMLQGKLLGSSGGVGTTKLIASHQGPGAMPALDDTAQKNPDHSYLNPGRAMLSKDTLPPFAAKGVASVTSSGTGGTICYLDLDRSPNWGKHLQTLLSDDPTKDGGYICDPAPFLFGGIPRYIGYNAPRTSHGRGSFGQPDVWTFLTKSPDSLKLPVIGDLFFNIRRGSQNASFDGRARGTGGVLSGMSALSRAQVYYHRPGAWQEPPNMLNPYWGARLASKGDALAGLFGAAGLSGAVSELLSDNVTMF